MNKASAPLLTGVVAGVAFYLHALVPNSHAWPLVWPAVAGVIAMLVESRRGSKVAFWGSVGIGLKTGAVAGAIFFVTTAVSVLLLSKPGTNSIFGYIAADGPINITFAVLIGVAMAAALGSLLGGISAGATYPLTKAGTRAR